MIIKNVRSLWLLLFGKRLDETLKNADLYIRSWWDIYRGEPYWKNYWTQGIGGRRLEYRYLLNPGKMICSEAAGLVFAEPPTINADKAVLDVLEYNRFESNCRDWLESCLALGSGCLKLVLTDSTPIIDFVSAPDFVPVTYDKRGIHEADFVSTVVNSGKTFKVVESHRKEDSGYRISFTAYEEVSSGEYRGVSLETAGVKDTGGYSDVKLFFPYFTPETNNLDIYSPMGVSIFANAVDTCQQIDRTFDYMEHELETSKRKIILPESMLRKTFDTEKKKVDRFYDKNDSVYVAFDADELNDMKPVQVAFDLRVDPIITMLNAQLAIFCKQCGFSDSFLSFDGTSMKTATEVISENSKTFRTKKNIEHSINDCVIPMLETMKSLEGITTTDMEYSIEWADSVIEDRGSRAKYWADRLMAKTATIEDALKELDGLDDEQAKEKADIIREQNATVDVNGLFGGAEW